MTGPHIADPRSPFLPQILDLYRSAFPENERRPLDALLRDGGLLFWLDGDAVAALAALLTWRDLTHILYLAVSPGLRAHGLGSRILREIRRLYPAHRILADLEAPVPDAPNRAQREMRLAFYRKNGYLPTSISYDWEGESYVILSSGGPVAPDEFTAFWDHFYAIGPEYDY